MRLEAPFSPKVWALRGAGHSAAQVLGVPRLHAVHGVRHEKDVVLPQQYHELRPQHRLQVKDAG
jgi:hypothetical protein